MRRGSRGCTRSRRCRHSTWAAIAVDKCVHFVEHDETQIVEETPQVLLTSKQHRFQRLGRDLQDAAPLAQKTLFRALRDVAMPALNRNVAAFQQTIKALKLVVDQRLERADVQNANRLRWLLNKCRDDGKEGRLGLATGSAAAE